MLYLVIKDEIIKFYLTNYGFDALKEIVPGDGNHLFKDSGPIYDINNTIKGRITFKERILYSILFWGKDTIFISDKKLNNFEIKHYIDFMEQVGANTVNVYFDRDLSKMNMDGISITKYADDFINNIDTRDMIGSAPPYYYKEKDNSIDLGELRRVKY